VSLNTAHRLLAGYSTHRHAAKTRGFHSKVLLPLPWWAWFYQAQAATVLPYSCRSEVVPAHVLHVRPLLGAQCATDILTIRVLPDRWDAAFALTAQGCCIKIEVMPLSQHYSNPDVYHGIRCTLGVGRIGADTLAPQGSDRSMQIRMEYNNVIAPFMIDARLGLWDTPESNRPSRTTWMSHVARLSGLSAFG